MNWDKWLDSVLNKPLPRLTIREEFLRKGVSYPVGTVREWKGKTYRKIAPGKWSEVTEKLTPKERGIRLAPRLDPPPEIGKELSEKISASVKGKNPKQNTKNIDQLYDQAHKANQELIDKTKSIAKSTGGKPALAPSVLSDFDPKGKFKQVVKAAKKLNAQVIVNDERKSVMIFDLDGADRLSKELKNSGITHKNSRGIKGRERAEVKAKTAYFDEKGNPDPSQLTDLVRASIRFDSIKDVYKALESIHNDPSMEIVKFTDRFRKPHPGGYRDISLKVRLSSGHVAELQLHLGKILDVKNGRGHTLFEEARAIQAKAAKEKRAFTSKEAKQIYQLVSEQERLYGQAYREGLRA